MKHKYDLDREVAMLTNSKGKYTASITATFIACIRDALVEDGGVVLEGLGRFSVKRIRRPPGSLKIGTFKKGETVGSINYDGMVNRIDFSKSPILKKQLKARQNQGD